MSNEMHVYCGDISNVPRVLTIHASQVNLTFTSDSSETRRGFKLSYQVYLRDGKKFYFYIVE